MIDIQSTIPHIGIWVRLQDTPRESPAAHKQTALLTRWSEAHQQPLLYLDGETISLAEGTLWGAGWRADLATDRWCKIARAPLSAIYNRFPLSRAPQTAYDIAALAARAGVPFANHPSIQALVRDKWETAQCLESAGLPTPETALDPDTWWTALRRWQHAFLKPREGAFGKGICALHWDGQALHIEGPTPGQPRYRLGPEAACTWLHKHECYLLQEAIPTPFPEYKGVSIRSLVQQREDHSWGTLLRIARASSDDPIANVARGATAYPLTDLLHRHMTPAQVQQTCDTLDQLDLAVVHAIQKARPSLPREACVELGIDYLLDPKGTPFVLEINGFPQGRLGHLADRDPIRFAALHARTLTQPLCTLLSFATQR